MATNDGSAFDLSSMLSLENLIGGRTAPGALSGPGIGGEGVPGTGIPEAGGGINLAGLGSGLQGLAGLASAWAGLQGIKLGKDQLQFTKGVTNRNLENQAQTINTNLEDRQQRRASASGAGYQSVADYMKRNQVNGGAI
jgi:hypothetical protein